MRKKKEIPVMNVGISLVILIFMVLCLVTFSVLSLENAVADQKLSEKTAEHTTAYYEAANALNRQLQEIDAAADAAAAEGGDYLAALRESLTAKGYEPAGEEDGLRLVLAEAVGEKQELTVTVTLPEASPGEYGTEDWSLAQSGEWEADQKLPVYQ